MITTFVGVVVLLAAEMASAAGIAASGIMEQTQTLRNTGVLVSTTNKVYWSGERLRSEQYGMDGVLIEIKNGKDIYEYTPATKSAVKITLQSDKGMTVQDVLLKTMNSLQPTSKIGSAKIAGIPCTVYNATIPGAKFAYKAKVWISSDARWPLPLKLDITMGSKRQITEIKNIKFNATISSTMFTVPKGTKVKVQKLTMPKLPAAKKPATGKK